MTRPKVSLTVGLVVTMVEHTTIRIVQCRANNQDYRITFRIATGELLSVQTACLGSSGPFWRLVYEHDGNVPHLSKPTQEAVRVARQAFEPEKQNV